jgi:hypothetical protein
MTATRAGATIELEGAVRENATQTVIAAPALTLDASRRGSVRSSAPGGVQVALEARPDKGDQLAVDVCHLFGSLTLASGTLHHRGAHPELHRRKW